MSWVKASRSFNERHRRLLNVFESLVQRHKSAAERSGSDPVVIGVMRLCLLTLAHARAVEHLNRTAPTLWPAAAAVSRCVLEAGVVASWIMRPDDTEARMSRWCAHFVHSQERFESGHAHMPQYAEAMWKSWKKTGKQFGIVFPPFDKLLEELGEPTVYRLYVWACQYTHGSSWAVDCMIDEQAPEDDASRWCTIFRASATGLALSGAIVFARLGVPRTSLQPLETIFRGMEKAWEAAIVPPSSP